MPKHDIELPAPESERDPSIPNRLAAQRIAAADKPIGVYDKRRAQREVSRPVFSRRSAGGKR